MSVWMKAAGRWGGILVLIALLITLIKQLIALVGFIGFAIKLFILFAFILLIVGVGALVLRGIRDNRKKSE